MAEITTPAVLNNPNPAAAEAGDTGGQEGPVPGLTRRQLLRQAALALTALGMGSLDPAAAQEVHRLAGEEKSKNGSFQPKAFKAYEYDTLCRLTELILPADEVSGSAVDAGVPQFIDLLASENETLRRIFTGGMLWLDHEIPAAKFLDAGEDEQTALLDRLAHEAREQDKENDPGYESYEASLEYQGFLEYTTEPPSPVGGGVGFFRWLRRLTVDGFYTSPMGIEDVDYRGNGATSQYEVPQEASLYALRRSPFR